jgi:hypothetical protein
LLPQENSDGYTRHNFTADISNYDLMDTYVRPFRMAVEQASAVGVMCAYNAIRYNGKSIPSVRWGGGFVKLTDSHVFSTPPVRTSPV